MQTYFIQLKVDQKWFDAINNLTAEVYDDEVCQWIRVDAETEGEE
jgi:hypothetical protein